MRLYITILFFSLSFICKAQLNQTDSEYFEIYKLHELTCDQVIDSMNTLNQVNGRAIGENGFMTSNYAYFLKLKHDCDIDKLLKLINHSNPVVRVYAYKALEYRNYKNIHEIDKILKKDKQDVRFMIGCKGGTLDVYYVVKNIEIL